MQVDTPPPSSSDVKQRKLVAVAPTTVNALTDKTWVPLGVLAAVVLAAITIHGAWRGTEGRLDLQVAQAETRHAAIVQRLEALERSSNESSRNNVQRDMTLLNMQRDVAELRAAMQRVEEAVSPPPGRTVRR